MKKITYYLSLILAIAIFSGCGTSDEVVNNGFIQKRKYNKGYHVEGFAKKNKTVATEVTENVEKVKGADQKVEFKNEQTINVEIPTSALANINENFIELAEKIETEKSSRVEVSEEITQSNTLTEKDQKLIEKVEKRATKIKQKIENRSNGASDDAVLYYVLAILIPWLAVGLVTDWDAKEVIINLLLSLLCYIPGVIHAFIVVGRYY